MQLTFLKRNNRNVVYCFKYDASFHKKLKCYYFIYACLTSFTHSMKKSTGHDNLTKRQFGVVEQ